MKCCSKCVYCKNPFMDGNKCTKVELSRKEVGFRVFVKYLSLDDINIWLEIHPDCPGGKFKCQ